MVILGLFMGGRRDIYARGCVSLVDFAAFPYDFHVRECKGHEGTSRSVILLIVEEPFWGVFAFIAT